MNRFECRVAVVTGGASGVGLAIVRLDTDFFDRTTRSLERINPMTSRGREIGPRG